MEKVEKGSKKDAKMLIDAFESKKAILSVLGRPVRASFTQEFPVKVVFPGISASSGSTGYYSFDAGTTISTFASPLVTFPLYLSSIINSVQGSPGYSGKKKVQFEQYQYMRVLGHRVTFINTAIEGSGIASGTVEVFCLTPLSFTVTPNTITSYNPSTGQTIPSDFYELDTSLRIQPNGLFQMAHKDFIPPKQPVGARISGTGAFAYNSWNVVSELQSLECSLAVGWETPPSVYNYSTGAASAGTLPCGVVSVETFVEYALPIKTQNI